MMSNNIQHTGRDRPFPWRCIECKEKEVYPLETDYECTLKHDDNSYTIRIPNLPIPTCRNCGSRVFTPKVDDRIVAALRDHIDLLTPQQIDEGRVQMGLSPMQLAKQLGVTEEMLLRWEQGLLIQSRAMDNLLRVYFESEQVRMLLQRRLTSLPAPEQPLMPVSE
jgi:putative zinc finger/helix-turn-helix YgiT family protein